MNRNKSDHPATIKKLSKQLRKKVVIIDSTSRPAVHNAMVKSYGEDRYIIPLGENEWIVAEKEE